MNPLYRSVPVTERTPKEADCYWVFTANNWHLHSFYNVNNGWKDFQGSPMTVTHWLEEIIEPVDIRLTDSELEDYFECEVDEARLFQDKLIEKFAIASEQMKAENEQLKKEIENEKWIFIDEEKPENGKAVLLHLKSGAMNIGYRRLDKNNFPEYQLFGDVGFSLDHRDEITHWRILPNAPK